MKFLRMYKGVLAGFISLLLFQLLRFFPSVIEALYTNGVYKGIRYIYNVTLTYIPIPLIYIFFLIILILIARRFFVKKKKRFMVFLLNLIGWLTFLFYWSWAFNYGRAPFHERAEIEIRKPDPQFLYQELLFVDSILVETRVKLQPVDTIAITINERPESLQEKIRRSQENLLLSLDQPIFATPKIRELKPRGILLRLKTAGVYFPFALEGHIDDGLHPIEKPHVMAHEMAHAYAFTDEGVCNFIGFMTCVNSDDPFIQYSGWLEYQGHLYRALRRNFPEMLKEKEYKLPTIVLTDIKAIRERLDKYPSIAPALRDLFYDNYLKVQGVSSGLESYSQITRLAYSYKEQHGNYQLRER